MSQICKGSNNVQNVTFYFETTFDCSTFNLILNQSMVPKTGKQVTRQKVL